MINLPSGCRIYFAIQPINMHASFDRLALLVEEVIQQSPLNGHLFVFRNRQKDKIKILWWDRNGFWIFYRRIEKGRFKIPRVTQDCIELSYEDLRLLLDGIDISKFQRFPESFRYGIVQTFSFSAHATTKPVFTPLTRIVTRFIAVTLG